MQIFKRETIKELDLEMTQMSQFLGNLKYLKNILNNLVGNVNSWTDGEFQQRNKNYVKSQIDMIEISKTEYQKEFYYSFVSKVNIAEEKNSMNLKIGQQKSLTLKQKEELHITNGQSIHDNRTILHCSWYWSPRSVRDDGYKKYSPQ